MINFESKPERQVANPDKTPLPGSLKVGIERHREFAEQELAELLDYLTKKMGEEVTFADLLSYEGGPKFIEQYKKVMTGSQVPYDLIVSNARLIETSRALKAEVMNKH